MLDLYDMAIGSSDEQVTFDLTNTESLSPFGALMLSITILECLQLNKLCKYEGPKNEDLKGLLSKSGFNNLFNLGDKTIPKDLITDGMIQLKKLDGLDPIFIETVSEMLEYHLEISEGLIGSLKMSMLEATQNVSQHSGGTEYYVCSWLYPEEDQLRICIADMGKGILESLKTTAKFMHLTDHNEAINLATQEGITSKPKPAGLGLHHIKGFLEVNEGQMCIISGRGKVSWEFDRGKITNQSMDHYFAGTILNLVINTSKEHSYHLASEEEPIF